MLKSKVLLATDNLSKKQQYGLDLAETSNMLDDAVMVASQVFDSAIVFVVINEIDYAWCNNKNFELPEHILKSLFDWVSQEKSTIQVNEFCSFNGFQEQIDKHLSATNKQLIGAPISVGPAECLGGLFVCLCRPRLTFLTRPRNRCKYFSQRYCHAIKAQKTK